MNQPRTMKCSTYEMFYLWNVLSMKCSIYKMFKPRNVLSMKCLSMKCPIYVLSMKFSTYEMSYLWNVLSMKCPLDSQYIAHMLINYFFIFLIILREKKNYRFKTFIFHLFFAYVFFQGQNLAWFKKSKYFNFWFVKLLRF